MEIKEAISRIEGILDPYPCAPSFSVETCKALEMAIDALKAQQKEDWIPIGKDMPDEYDSVFTRFCGTDKWRDGMWLKSSAKVLVTVEFEDGTRLTETAKTIDGKWATENYIRKRKVVAWQKMPKEYKGK